MKEVNVVLFFIIGTCFLVSYIPKEPYNKWLKKWRDLVKDKHHLMLVLLIANILSFMMAISPIKEEIYIEKNDYGEEERQIPFLLKKGDITQELILTVPAKKMTEEELQKRIDDAFLYIESNMKAENAAFTQIYSDLDYSLDYEKYPFSAEFVSGDMSLIDRDGIVHNDRKVLEGQGYSQAEIDRGISTDIVVTLWYGERSFEKTFSLVVFPKKEGLLQQQFEKVKETIVKAEQNAIYQDGFSIPTRIDSIEIHRTDEREITSGHVLLAGIILVFLLLLREQENKKKAAIDRKRQLVRSYPWFVNEMVLLLGAGMQTRNIFGMLIRDFEGGKEDYRNTLIEELKGSVHAMELGMSEEQAYYRLGRRLGLPCYIKIMTLLEQNSKRGGKGITDILEEEEMLALEERKNLAKKYGEEAGTKLLGPMVLLLLVVMLMIMIPALWSFA